jgi:hypothetical protein
MLAFSNIWIAWEAAQLMTKPEAFHELAGNFPTGDLTGFYCNVNFIYILHICKLL